MNSGSRVKLTTPEPHRWWYSLRGENRIICGILATALGRLHEWFALVSTAAK